MKRPISGGYAGVTLCALLAWSAAGLRGQTTGVAPASGSTGRETETEESRPNRFSWGLRVRTYPLRALSVMEGQRSMNTLTSGGTVYDRQSKVTSDPSYLSGGPAIEIGLSRKTSLRAEVLFTRLRYENVVDMFSGTDDPATGHDERSHATATEKTRARLWDVPVMLHYNGIGRSGILSRVYLGAGATARNVSTIRTNTEITNADATKSANNFSARPDRRNLLGGSVGIGFRFIDDFNVNVTPEVRFTRWTGRTFPASPKNQIEFGIGITY